MPGKWLYISFVAALLLACTKSKDSFIEEEVTVSENESLTKSATDQNRWIYKAMDEEYYWRGKMPDSAKLDFKAKAQTFFDHLLYKQEDRFSWIESNSQYYGVSLYSGYGIDYASYVAGNVEIHRAILVNPQSDAAKSGLKRGDWFTYSLNGNSVSISTGNIREGRFAPDTSYALMAVSYTEAVSFDTIYYIGSKKIAYLFYNEFMDGSGLSNPYRSELNAIFSRFNQAGVTDLVIDLRYNPGGHVSICQYLCSLVLPDEYLGTISGYHEFNDKLAQKQFAQTGNQEEILYFPTKNNVGGYNLGLKKVYAIVTKRSASASESLVNSLSSCIEVVKVGTTTYGKGVGSWTIRNNRYQWQLQPITFRYFNNEHQAVPASGLEPDIYADESTIEKLYQLGDTREYLLNIVLSQISGESAKRQAAGNYRRLGIQPIDIAPNLQGRLHGLIDTKPE